MRQETLLLICVIFTGLTLAAVVGAVIILLRRASGAARPRADSNDHFGIARIDLPVGVDGWLPDSVISRLSFAQSIDAERFAAAVHETAISNLNRRLASSG